MDVLQALGGWRNINQEKLEQIKVDNAPLYDAITKAINLLAKKYGGEDIIVQKPIEVVAENLEPSELSYLEQSILLSNRRSDPTSFSEIFESVEKVALQKFQLNTSNLTYREKIEAIEKLVKDGYLYNTDGYNFIFTEKGEDAVNKIVSYVGQPPQETPSDEELASEIVQRMADYYEVNEFKLLSQDDVITNAVKHQFDIPSNKYFGLVVKLLQDGFVEKDPSGLTDSIRLTANGYDESQGWYEENKPAEEKPSENLDVPYLQMIQKLREKKGDWVTIEDIVAEKGVPNMLTRQEYIDAQKTILDDLEKRKLVNIVSDEFTISGEGRRLLDLNPEVETPIEQPAQFQLTDLQISILEAVEEAGRQNINGEFVKIVDIWRYNMGIMPINYAVYQMDITTPSLQQDLAILYANGYLEFAQSSLEAKDFKYMLSLKGIEFLSDKKVKTTTTPTPAQTQLTDLQISILEAVEEASATKIGDGFVSINEIWGYNRGMMPLNYDVYQDDLTPSIPSLQKDLQLLYTEGYLEFQFASIGIKGYTYRLSQKGKDFLKFVKVLNSSPTTQPIVQPTPPTTNTNLRPSPTDSATMYPTGRIKVGNDANLWKVTENKNGVKRWVKVGDIPSELPDPTNLDLGTFTFNKTGQSYRVSLVKGNKKEWVEVDSIANPTPVETPISEIDEDEVDLDILEQQLNDDSLEFDITDEDLDNLEF